MKSNKLVVILTLMATLSIFTGNHLKGCDVCGCSVGGNSMGILPQFQNNFVGLRHHFRAYDSKHLTLFPGEIPLKTVEKFYTTELWGRYVPSKNIHLFAFIPYNYYAKDEENIHSKVSGLGDISFLANYVIINTGEYSNSRWKHALQAGTGLKLPTGVSDNIQKHSGLLIPSLQAGTGAFDIPINLIYTVRRNQLGLNIENNYRINMPNRRNYRFGDRFNSSVRIFYWQKFKNMSLLPHVGASYEYGFMDKDRRIKQEYTGSNSVLGNAGIDLYFGRFILNFSTQISVYQHIAQGQISARQQYRFGVAVFIDKTKNSIIINNI